VAPLIKEFLNVRCRSGLVFEGAEMTNKIILNDVEASLQNVITVTHRRRPSASLARPLRYCHPPRLPHRKCGA
jgi:hypothetical protein